MELVNRAVINQQVLSGLPCERADDVGEFSYPERPNVFPCGKAFLSYESGSFSHDAVYIVGVMDAASTCSLTLMEPTRKYWHSADYSVGAGVDYWRLHSSNLERSVLWCASEQAMETEARSFLTELYLNTTKLTESRLLTFLFDRIEASFAEENLAFLNSVLCDFEPNKTKRIASTGLLRATSRARSRLSEWQLCLGRVWQMLDASGENPKKILRGLIASNDPIKFAGKPSVL